MIARPVVALVIVVVVSLGVATAAETPQLSAAGPASASPTTSPPTTTAALRGLLPTPVATIPFSTKAQSAHVNPLFAYLSGVGFLVAIVIMATQYVLTRPGRRRRTL